MPQLIEVPGIGPVEFPDGMTDDQIVRAIKANDPKQPSGIGGVLANDLEMLKNIPASAGRLVGGVATAVMHPSDTAGVLMDTAAGGLRNMVPEGLRRFIDKANTPDMQKSSEYASNVADKVGQLYKDRYGGAENIRNTYTQDPVGLVADLSTVLGVGGAMLPGKAGAALKSVSAATNPLAVLKPATKLAGNVSAGLIGELGTHTGMQSVKTAFKAGASGGDDAAAFQANMRGKVPMTDVIDDMKSGVAAMRAAKSAEYRTNMAGVASDKTVLDFKGIDKAISNAAQIATFKGQVKNARAADVVQQMADDVKQWKALNPNEFHTPEGLDALKQRLGGMMESLPFEERTARLAAGEIYSAVKAEITKQAPTYAKTMKDYSEASDLIREIERTLSAGERVAADTALRKLQSILRNNANTNYGNRADLIAVLEAQGGKKLLPALAGQSMNALAPRGLGKVAASVNVGAGITNPALLGLLPFQSPRLMGESAYYAGKVSPFAGTALDPAYLLGAGQSGLLQIGQNER
jgi:hypothetical protein